MNLYCLGIDYKRSSMALRERLAFAPAAIEEALSRFHDSVRQLGNEPTEELAILSTCNRVEIYGYLDSQASFSRLEDILGGDRGIHQELIEQNCYRISRISVVEHLSHVASGLDSMILGEPQILGQVSRTIDVAKRSGSAGPVLSGLFDSAIRAGRRARHETAINRKPSTVGSVAAALARKVSTPNTRAVIVGAGDVATGLVRVLSKSAFSEITIVNRTLATALDLADRWGATALPLEKLSEALSTADVVITSTASRHPIISDDMIRHALKDRSTRRDRLITIIDLGMPRDVDPEVRLIDGVELYDLDDLRLVTGELTEERTQAIPLVETIIFEEVDRFRQWFDGLAVAPLISDLRRKAEQIRISATSDALRQLPHIDPETRRQFEHLSRTLVNRILHDPTTRLRAAATTGVVGGKAEAIQHLFDLPARSKPNPEDRQ